MKGIVESPQSRMAGFVSNSPVSDEWHTFMLSTLSEITAVQCRPLGGFAYPNRHDDMMTDFSQSNDNEDNEDELDDDTLAEQVLRLGLNHNVDETEDEEERHIEIDSAKDDVNLTDPIFLRATQVQEASVLEVAQPFNSGPLEINTAGFGKEDDEGWDVAGSEGQGEGGNDSETESTEDGNNDFANFGQIEGIAVSNDSECGDSAMGFADFMMQSTTETAIGSRVGVEPEADDFACWGDFSNTETSSSEPFADFSDFSESSPLSTADDGAPESPLKVSSPAPPPAISSEASLDFDSFVPRQLEETQKQPN